MKSKLNKNLSQTTQLDHPTDSLFDTMKKSCSYSEHLSLSLTCKFFNQNERLRSTIQRMKPQLFAKKNHCFFLSDLRLFYRGGFCSSSSTRFKEINLEQFQDVPIKKLVTGDDFLLILLESGRLFGKGKNTFGQLGLEEKRIEIKLENDFVEIVPSIPKSSKIIDLFAGDYCSFIKLDTGQIYAAGRNYNGELGLTRRIQFSLFFQEVPLPTQVEIIQLESRGDRTFLLDKEGGLWGAGESGSYRLGLKFGQSIEGFESIKSPILANTTITKVFVGAFTTVLLTSNDKLIGFGNHMAGEFGFQYTRDTLNSVFHELPFSIPEGTSIKDIVLGTGCTLILLSNGQVFGCGNYSLNRREILGIEELTLDYSSRAIKTNQLVRGDSHTFLLLNNHEIWACLGSEFSPLASKDELLLDNAAPQNLQP